MPRRSSIGAASAIAARAVAASRARMAARSSPASCTVAVGVGDDDVQPQVRRHGGRVEIGRPHGDPGDLGQRRGQRVDEPAVRLVRAGQRRPRDRLGQRDQLPADLLRQRAHERLDQLVAVARDLPVEAVVGRPG